MLLLLLVLVLSRLQSRTNLRPGDAVEGVVDNGFVGMLAFSRRSGEKWVDGAVVVLVVVLVGM